jgi:transmembrane 9 superfamily protein 2/4
MDFGSLVCASQVHWLSILNSLLVLTLLSGVVAIVMFRTIRRDLAKYEDYLVADPEAEKLTAAESEAGWKVLKGDVFRSPANPKLLSTMVGSGLQIFASSSLTLLFGALGFLSPAVRGAMLSTLLGMYMLLSMVAGFCSVYMHGCITRSHWAWRGVSLRTTVSVPAILILVLVFLNLIIKHTGASVPPIIIWHTRSHDYLARLSLHRLSGAL